MNTIRNIGTIAARDFRAFFSSPIFYIVTAGFMVIMGWMFFNNLSYFNLQNMQHAQYQYGQSTSITEGIVRPLYGNMNVMFLFFAPFITMRLFSEERKMHTIELLLTSPITLGELVIGKFLASFYFVLFMLVATMIYPVILYTTGNPDLGPIATSYLGTFLMTSCYLALGLFFSSMTENQIVAGALTFAAGLFFWLINWASQMAGTFWGEVLQYLSLIQHFNNFARGVIATSDLIFYVSFIGLSLFFTHRVMDSYRWR